MKLLAAPPTSSLSTFIATIVSFRSRTLLYKELNFPAPIKFVDENPVKNGWLKPLIPHGKIEELNMDI
ncbi:hypothetical protein LguiA_036510 [Lonicera macranthoides]